MTTVPCIPEKWQRVLDRKTIEKADACMAAVERERAEGNTIYPPSNQVYRALDS